MDSKKIGKLIAKRRKEKGMTQGELAERLSVSNKTISKWETGVGLPDISILVDLASVLDISVDDLLKGKENKVQNALCEKNFLIKKKYYKKYLRDHFFESKAYWLFNFIGIMFILGGFAFLSLQQYTHHYVDILGKSFIVLGIILVLFPFIQIFFKSNFFKEHEVFYTLKIMELSIKKMKKKFFIVFSNLKESSIKILYF